MNSEDDAYTNVDNGDDGNMMVKTMMTEENLFIFLFF